MIRFGIVPGPVHIGPPWILPSFPVCSGLVLPLWDSLPQLFMPSNLEIINSKFQSHCWQLIRDSPLQSFIICDFPSQIQNPKSIFKFLVLMILPTFWAQSSLWLVLIYTLLHSNSLCWPSSLILHILLLLPFIYLLEQIFPFPWKSNSLNCTTLYHPPPGKRLLTFILLLISKFPCEGKRDPYQNNLMFFNYTFHHLLNHLNFPHQ